MRGEVMKGHVDLLLLRTLHRSPSHGYGIVESLRERSEGAFHLAEGTVYPALYRLERQGLVASSRRTVDGRRRRIYRLTTAGVAALAERRRRWAAFTGAVESILA
jgi:PadR family transcriptional regulator